ncbi:MAG: hypothetical protein KDD78_04105, partial [Caldilineaceae bacterium]|nr:hypothetical protein [Caldilineaceae bacterium]
VGMATNIPPHNLGEVVDALTYMLDRYDHLEDVTVEHLLQFIKGPDFPTGGILYRYREEKGSDDLDAITQGYSMGKARLILQAKAHFEEMSRNRSRIVVTELPYQTNKTALIERIANLVRDGKIEGITDLRDESDRTGMRIVIELTRNVEPKDILADLFKYTPLQQTFGMQMLALVDGQPRLLGLKRILQLFIQHRQEIIRRRSEYELARARERAHILEGLLKALDILDEVIATIRRSQTVETARNNLVKNFQFTLIQAQAILDMQLRRLAALERKRLQQEYDELLKRIAYLEDLLAHPEKVLAVIKEDMLAIKEKYADPRRTQIVDRTKGTLTTTDLLPEQDVWVTVGSDGMLLRTDVARVDKRTVRDVGKSSQVALLNANTRDFLYLFAHDGRTARIAIHEIPQDGGGKHYADLTEFSRRDGVHAAITVPRLDSSAGAGYLFFVTEQAMVKRVAMADFLAAAAADPIVMNVDSKDRLAAVFATPGQQDVILVSSGGKSIRFNEDDVRSMGLAAGGVGGMKLKKGERIVYAGLVDPAGELATITASGYAKRSRLDDYATQGRNGGGIVTHKPTARTGVVSAARVLTAFELSQSSLNLALVTSKNKVAVLTLDEIPAMGRAVQGKQVMAVGMSDEVSVLHALGDAPDPAAGDENGAGAGPNAAGMGKNGSTTVAAGGASARNGAGHVKGKNQSRAPAARAVSQPRAASSQKASRAKASPLTEASGKTSTRKSTSKSPVQPNAAA